MRMVCARKNININIEWHGSPKQKIAGQYLANIRSNIRPIFGQYNVYWRNIGRPLFDPYLANTPLIQRVSAK
jgi:hypothetical protein